MANEYMNSLLRKLCILCLKKNSILNSRNLILNIIFVGNHFRMPILVHLNVHLLQHLHKYVQSMDNHLRAPILVYLNVHLLQHLHKYQHSMDNHLHVPI